MSHYNVESKESVYEDNPRYCYTNEGHEGDPDGNGQITVQFQTADERAHGPETSAVSTTNRNEPKHPVHGSSAKFVPDHPIQFRIRGVVRSISSRKYSTLTTYKIQIAHAGYYWTIFRNYEQLHAVFLNLYFVDIALRLKYELFIKTHGDQRVGEMDIPEGFPALPPRLRTDATADSEAVHFELLERSLNLLFNDSFRREHASSLRFLEVSKYSFHSIAVNEEKIREIGVERLVCFLKDHLGISCNHDNAACSIFSHWNMRWIVVLETCYFYVDLKNESGDMSCLFLFDKSTKPERLHHRPLGLIIKHAMKDLTLKFDNTSELENWLAHFERTMGTTALPFVSKQPHDAFAPVRQGIPCHWFINGATYMSAVADALESAEKEIFIGGWWVSPEVFLKRPWEENEEWRLDRILKRKADQGVKIYILVYKESRIALGINSWYSKKKLMKLSPNIIVKRHPDKNVVLWSHHEKTVTIDQKIVFLGGIDLCYGRWDTHLHHLSDLSPAMVQENDNNKSSKKGKSEKRNRGLMCSRAGQFKNAPIRSHNQRLNTMRLVLAIPWRSAKARFYHPKHKLMSRTRYNSKMRNRDFKRRTSGAYRRVFGRRDNHNAAIPPQKGSDDPPPNMHGCWWLGKDYCNEVKMAFTQPNDGKPYEDALDRFAVPRLPWHDAGVVICGAAAQDIARHFIQKWNVCKLQKFRFDEQGPFLMPKKYFEDSDADFLKNLPWETVSCSIQAIRSTASWSGGLAPDIVETSIQQSYIDLILNAKHFVYIESQFFITAVGRGKNVVENKIGDALFNRIQRAFHNNENFRVFVIIPLQPAIAGQYGTREGSAVQAVTHFIYQSISRGEHSLLEKLKLLGCDFSKYITFCGLRQFGMIGDNVATEIVYVHSKMIIVDDLYTIIGSANLNDRSMLGSRDSEIGILIQDEEFDPSVMDGQPYMSGKFSGRLRKRLMKIHLGLAEDMDTGLSPEESDKLVVDPVSEEFFRGLWIKTAVDNDAIYQQVRVILWMSLAACLFWYLLLCQRMRFSHSTS
ncbi:phospholipase D2-like isoform X2 [Paramacrobiotus metropolitanus]|uniref:phospholipase D2-like isoform X2 n=1 Tax=Paramacrobiotus metropolitanus TaxID=2943436 RepID=UPI002446047E|nr:phospholipase D2-like isoform X2 [Paramacrobiotus metropolitanus]